MASMMRLALIGIAVAPALAGCSVFQIQDSYGNRYGGWYEHGDQYQSQLALCEHETAGAAVAAAQRPVSMRECMWRHGVPKDNITPAAGT
ncbi:MAG: hypothetical protein KGL11_06305 [Alphaproteobacteria bacterium]|nr:hypothetical protein [Alphaproteobacteria bacterium]